MVTQNPEPAEGQIPGGKFKPYHNPEEQEEVPLESAASRDKGLTEVAKEVQLQKWGKGQERRRRLIEAGYDPNEVYDEVVRLLNEK